MTQLGYGLNKYTFTEYEPLEVGEVLLSDGQFCELVVGGEQVLDFFSLRFEAGHEDALAILIAEFMILLVIFEMQGYVLFIFFIVDFG